MAKFLQTMMQIMQVLPMVIQAVEIFAPAGQGPAKKEAVKDILRNQVTDDPAYDNVIDQAIELTVAKGVNAAPKGGTNAPSIY